MVHRKRCIPEQCRCEERGYWLVFGLAGAITVLEFVGGWASGSLALVSDAFHVLTDAAAGAASILVAFAIRRKIGSKNAVRAAGGLASGALLGVASAFVLFEAIMRLQSPRGVFAPLMITVALLGAVGNYVQHRVLKRAEADHITHRAAKLHVFSDLWQSVGVVAAGLFISMTGWTVADPLVSVAVALVMMFWTVVIVYDASVTLLRESS